MKPRTGKGKKVMSLWVDAELKEALEARALRDERSVSFVAEKILERGVKHLRGKRAA